MISNVLKRVADYFGSNKGTEFEPEEKHGDIIMERRLHMQREAIANMLESHGYLMDDIYADDKYGRAGSREVSNKISIDEFKEGSYKRYFDTAEQLAEIQGLAVEVMECTSLGINLMILQKSYVLSVGFAYAVEAKDEAFEESAEAAEKILKAFVKSNKWKGKRQVDSFEALRTYGERFIELVFNDDGKTTIKLIPSVWVVEPVEAEAVEEYYGLGSDICWKYGVATPHDDTSEVLGIFVSPNGDSDQWRFVDADSLIFTKNNTPEFVKRGLPDCRASGKWATKAEKLTSNTIIGGTIQAAIALIRSHSKTSSAAGIKSGASTVNFQPTGSSTKTKLARESAWLPGTVLDVKDIEYDLGAIGKGGAAGLSKLGQDGDRRFGISRGVPYHMISGDASNGNYKSTLASESPMVKAMVTIQADEVETDSEIALKVLIHAAESGLIPGCSSAEDIEEKLSVVVEPPDITPTDSDTDHKQRMEELKEGVISTQTYREETGRDHDEEKKRLDDEKGEEPDPGDGGGGDDGDGDGGGNKPTKKDVSESRRERIKRSVLKDITESLVPAFPEKKETKTVGNVELKPDDGGTYKFSSTQYNLEDFDKVFQLGYSIPDSLLTDAGREIEPHVTVLYGLHTKDINDVAMIASDFVDPDIRVGTLSSFPAGDDGVPIVVRVNSPELVRQHNDLKTLDNSYSFPEYNPHITIAYVKPEKAEEALAFVDVRFREIFTEGEVVRTGKLQFSPH